MNKPLRIALFGFGRIGRNIFRIGFNNPLFEFVAISDLGQPESMHYLLMRDSIHGTMSDEIKLDGNNLVYNNHKVRLLEGGTPGSIPWDAKKGSQPDFVINPQVPCPIKQRAAVIRRVQCNWVCKTLLSPE